MPKPSRLQVLSDRFRDKGFVSHSHELWGSKLLKYTQTLPTSQVKTNLIEIAVFVSSHKEMCYRDFVDHFKTILDDDTVRELLAAFADKPGVIKNLEATMRADHPNIQEGEWKW